jgi:predicted dehydrogenase
MKRVAALLCFLALPLAAQEYKIAVVSMLHAHVWLHLGTMLNGDKVKLVGLSETLPDLIHRATHEDVIPQTQNVTRPGVPESHIFADWKRMIDETKPDIVWAFTPTNGHLEVVRYCAPKGIHVIMEKPLAATFAEALEIQALARRYHILVLTNYGSTWQAGQYAAKAAIDAGEIGKVWRLHGMQGSGGPGDPKTSSFAAWLADPLQNGGGAMMDFGCYLALWSVWLKGMPDSVYATVQHIKPETFPQGGRQRHHHPELQGRSGDTRGELGLSAGATPGQRNLRHERQHRGGQHPQSGRATSAAGRGAHGHSATAGASRADRVHGGPNPQQPTDGRSFGARPAGVRAGSAGGGQDVHPDRAGGSAAPEEVG